jgi:hypothetical protein
MSEKAKRQPNPYGLKPGDGVIMEVRKGTLGILPTGLDCFDYIQQRTALDERGRRVEGNMVVIIGRVLR